MSAVSMFEASATFSVKNRRGVESTDVSSWVQQELCRGIQENEGGHIVTYDFTPPTLVANGDFYVTTVTVVARAKNGPEARERIGRAFPNCDPQRFSVARFEAEHHRRTHDQLGTK